MSGENSKKGGGGGKILLLLFVAVALAAGANNLMNPAEDDTSRTDSRATEPAAQSSGNTKQFTPVSLGNSNTLCCIGSPFRKKGDTMEYFIIANRAASDISCSGWIIYDTISGERIREKAEDAAACDQNRGRISFRAQNQGLLSVSCSCGSTRGADEIYIYSDASDPYYSVYSIVRSAVRECAGKTQRDTAMKLENWLCSYLTPEIDMSIFSEFGREALMSGKARCSGYSAAYVLMLREAGIPAFMLTGTGYADNGSGPHAWVIARLDGVWVFIDPTWDDIGNSSSYRYFGLDYRQISKDHVISMMDEDFCNNLLNGAYERGLNN